jgi:hypothetical protein
VSSKAVVGGQPTPAPEQRRGAVSDAAKALAEAHRRDLADRFGDLDAQVQRFKPTAKAHEGLRKEIQALYDAEPSGNDFKLLGAKYEVQIGPRDNERKVSSMAKLFKALTQAVFLLHCSVPMKIIDALLPGDKQKDLVVTARSGSRPVKAVALPAPEEKAA